MSKVEIFDVKSDIKNYFAAYKFSHGLGSPISQKLEEKLKVSLAGLSFAQTKSLYEEFVRQYGLILEGMMPMIEAQNIDAMQIHMPTCHACGSVLEMLEAARFDTTDKRKVVGHLEKLPTLSSAMIEYGEYTSFNSRKCRTPESKQQFDSIEKEMSAHLTLQYINRQCNDKLSGGEFSLEEAMTADREYLSMQRNIDRYSAKLKNLPKKVDFMYYDQDNAALQKFINKIRNYAFVQVDKYTNPAYGVSAMSSKLQHESVM